MTTERRRFFRIDDEAEISFKMITDEEYQAWEDGQLDDSNETINQIDTELESAIEALANQHPQLATICTLLNKKINLSICGHAKTHGFIDHGELKPVNLSACGISFHTEQKIPDDENLLLQLKLKPSDVAIITAGKVVGSGIKDGKQIVRVDFQDLDDHNQNLLMQHLFQVQSRELKKKRDHN